MKAPLSLLILIVYCLKTEAQLPTTCANMAPICTDVGLTFTAQSNVTDASITEPGNNYYCLNTTPNPTWYYFEIATSGNIDMALQANMDIDFAIWGPFNNLNAAISNCGNLGMPIDCSYDPTQFEAPSIPNGIVGEVYIMLITNYANSVQDVTLFQTGGTGSTDCTILDPCSIEGLSANLTNCYNNGQDLFDIDGTLTFINPPTTGSLIVESCDGIQQIFYAPFVSPLNYTLTGLIQNGANCSVTASFSDSPNCTFSTNILSPNPISSTTFPGCGNSSLIATISGGQPALDGSNFTAANLAPVTAYFTNNTCSNNETITVGGLQPGEFYSFEVSDIYGCVHTVSGGPFTDIPIANAGDNDTICFSLTDTLAAIPSFGTGIWTSLNGVSFGNINHPNSTVTVPQPGIYPLVWTESNGPNCTASDTIFARFIDFTIDYNSTAALCNQNNGSVTILIQGNGSPYEFALNNGIFQTNPTISGLSGGLYQITVKDKFQCFSDKNVAVPESSTASINALNTINPTCYNICNGSIAVNASGAVAYSIDNGTTTQTGNVFQNLCAGIYYISAIDPNGCSAIQEITLNAPSELIKNFSKTDLNCNGQCTGNIALSVSGGTPPYGYSIYNGTSPQTTPEFNSLCAGIYNVLVTDANGCLVNDYLTLTEPSQLTLDLLKDHVSCNGACDGWITANVSGGVPPYNYIWSQGGNNAVPSITNLCSGNYNLLVSDYNNCTIDSNNITITEPDEIIILQFVKTDESCWGNGNGSIHIESNVQNYSLDNVNYGSDGQFSNLSPGNYIVYIKNPEGCVLQYPFEINPGAIVTLDLPSDTTVCIGASLFVNPTVTGGNSPYLYNWSNGLNYSLLFITLDSSISHYLQISDANGCLSNIDTINISTYDKLSVLVSDTIICQGDSTQLIAQVTGGFGAYYYNWFNGLSQNEFLTVKPDFSTNYIIAVTDQCETPAALDTATIIVIPKPVVSFFSDVLEGCIPLTCQFQGIEGFTHEWNTGDGTIYQDSAIINHTYIEPGIYNVWLTLTDTMGCRNSIGYSKYIQAYPNPEADFKFSPEITTILEPQIQLVNLSNGENEFTWHVLADDHFQFYNEDVVGFTFPNSDSGTYQVCLAVSNEYGCYDSICHNIHISLDARLFVPNAFTPNGDGWNEEFLPVISGNDPAVYNFWIFDRWGKLVFQTNDFTKGWSGTDKGKDCKQDTYVWKIQFKDGTYTEVYEYVGHVNLLR